MHKNRIVLASLAGLFSLNCTANAWMPSKDNALVYAAGGLAVVTTGVLAYQVYKLAKQVAASDETSKTANQKLAAQMESKLEAPDISGLAKKEDMSKEIDTLRTRLTQNKTDFMTIKKLLEARLTQIEAQLTQIDIPQLATKKDLKEKLDEMLEAVRYTDTFCGKRFKSAEQAHDEAHDKLKADLENALEEYKKEITKLISDNDTQRQLGVIRIQQKLNERINNAIQSREATTKKDVETTPADTATPAAAASANA